MTKVSKSNTQLISELNSPAVLADEQGYWKARGHEEFPGWAALPFADFFEDLSGPGKKGDGHKKMWLTPNGGMKEGRLSDCRGSLIPLYGGIIETQRSIVSAGFFWYSALIVQLHLTLAYYSRKLDVAPTVKAVVESGNEKAAADVKCRAIALRVAAFIVYEGDGLGGYKPENWAFYGRLFGKACPTDDSILDGGQAADAAKAYKEASPEERVRMFTDWWNLVHCDKDGTPSYPDEVVRHLHTAHVLVSRYRQMESPMCPKDNLFDVTCKEDIQAALSGFFRRSAKGHAEAVAYDSNDTNVHRFSDMLVDEDGEVLGKVTTYLTDNSGCLSPFGDYLVNLLEIHQLRNELVDRIVARDEESAEAKEGFSTKLSKRGRRRRM